MDEWAIVTVLIALTGLFMTVAKPILGLNSTITRLSENVERLESRLTEFSENNTDSHRRLWAQCDGHAKRLEAHETRIAVLEQR